MHRLGPAVIARRADSKLMRVSGQLQRQLLSPKGAFSISLPSLADVQLVPPSPETGSTSAIEIDAPSWTSVPALDLAPSIGLVTKERAMSLFVRIVALGTVQKARRCFPYRECRRQTSSRSR